MQSKYEFYFSNWINDNLPNSSEGVIVSNIDYMIFNYKTKKFLMIELKTKGNVMNARQRNIYNMLHKRFMKTNGIDGYKFIGTYLITFNGENRNDGFVRIEGSNIEKKIINEEDCKELFNKLLGYG